MVKQDATSMPQITRHKDVLLHLVKKSDNESPPQEHKRFNIDDAPEAKQLIDNSFPIEKKKCFHKELEKQRNLVMFGLALMSLEQVLKTNWNPLF